MGHAVKGASALCAPRTAASKSCAGKDGDERMPAGNGTHQEPPPLTLNWAMLISTRTSLPPCMRRQAATNGRGVVSTSALSGPAAQEAMTALTLVKRKQSHSTAPRQREGGITTRRRSGTHSQLRPARRGAAWPGWRQPAAMLALRAPQAAQMAVEVGPPGVKNVASPADSCTALASAPAAALLAHR